MKKLMLSLFVAFGFSSCSLNDTVNDECGTYQDMSFTGFPLLCNYSVKNMPNNATAVIINTQEKMTSNFTKKENSCTVASDPNIDFTENFLIAIYAGAKPTSGYAIKITSVVESNCQIVINYIEKSPLADETVSGATTYPSDFVLIPKTTKPIYVNKTGESPDALIIGSYSGQCTSGNCANFLQLSDYNSFKFQDVVVGKYEFEQYKSKSTSKRGEFTAFAKIIPAEILAIKGQTKVYGSPSTSTAGAVYFELRQGATVTKITIDLTDTADQSAEIKAFKKIILEKSTGQSSN